SIPYMHFAKWIVSTKRNKRRLVFLILLFIIWALSGFFYNWYAFPTLVVNVYVVWGPIAYFAVKLGLLQTRIEFEDKN
ncbi:MAG: hypothetical protein J6Q65_03375, partial [Lentisphaeria bacterium]|nr:hypothetical protein [Lentisphaeria bacterium]